MIIFNPLTANVPHHTETVNGSTLIVRLFSQVQGKSRNIICFGIKTTGEEGWSMETIYSRMD